MSAEEWTLLQAAPTPAKEGALRRLEPRWRRGGQHGGLDGTANLPASFLRAMHPLGARRPRYVTLLKLADNTAEAVRSAVCRKILAPSRAPLQCHVGPGQGDVPASPLHPNSPWQRGTNENRNGLLRQYFLKGTDLAAFTESELDAVAQELIERPRQTLGWMTQTHRLAEVVASTA